jgi:sugar (pentulose or hexulose) kinase
MAKKNTWEDCVLAIDAGTQSIRAALIDFNGNIKKIVKTEIEPYFSVQPGWAEQNPDYFWKTLCATSKKLFSDKSIQKDSIKAVSLTTQRNTMINLDKDGKPLRPAIIWLDRRKAKAENWPPAYLKYILKAINMYDTAIYTIMECEANWIAQNQPEIWDRTYKFLFLSGYFTYKLTGEFTDSTGNQVGYVPFDFKKQEWSKDSDFKWKMFPYITRDRLATLVKPSEFLGAISKKASKETGIPEGLPVIAAAADKACEVLGSGCLSPDIACLSFGTTATIETTNSKYVEIIPFLPPYPSAVPGAYNTEVMIYRGYWMVSWFKNEFAHNEMVLAQKKCIPVEVLLDDMACCVPPGSMGLMLQPFWSPGVKVPGPEAKGAIIGFGDVHTKAHVYRAILEGLSYALKEGAIRTEKRNKIKIEKLRVSGGGSQSRCAMQLTADIFNLPAERPHTYETSALGAAIDAAVGIKVFSDFKSAVQSMTRVADIFEPDKKNSKLYGDLFENVYMKLYNKLKPLYEEIREVTGYPPFYSNEG